VLIVRRDREDYVVGLVWFIATLTVGLVLVVGVAALGAYLVDVWLLAVSGGENA
jgi:hypothetical protein